MLVQRPVPPKLARLWRLPSTERRGRPAALSVDLVVRHAVGLADSVGLEGVTIPKVAAAVGCSTMALYRHVSSKDELLVLMTDLAAGEAPDIDTEVDAWRQGLRAWARALYAVTSAHPWITRVPISGPPSGPAHMAWLDAALHTLRGTGLGWAEKVGVVTLTSGYVHQAVRLATDHEAALAAQPAEAYRAYGESLAELVDPARFPDAAQLFAAQVFAGAEFESDPVGQFHFTFGLELILDGVECKVRTSG